jgi:hypothetical protein
VEDQTRISLAKAEVQGIDPDAKGLLRVAVALTPRPDVAWSALFQRGPVSVSWPVSMHPPRLEGGRVRMRPPDAEVDAYMAKLRELVQSTNEQYAREVLPRLRAEAEARERDEAEGKRRIEEAQRRLDEDA